MIVLGIDPGLTGALALVRAGKVPQLIAVADVPTVGEKAKRRVKVSAVLSFLQKHKIDHGFIERAQAMPGDGGSSAFIYGRAVGALEASMAGMQIKWRTVESRAWKVTHGLVTGSTKEHSRQRAIQLFGDEFFKFKYDHNRAEAALIAYHGLKSIEVNFPGVHKEHSR